VSNPDPPVSESDTETEKLGSFCQEPVGGSVMDETGSAVSGVIQTPPEQVWPEGQPTVQISGEADIEQEPVELHTVLLLVPDPHWLLPGKTQLPVEQVNPDVEQDDQLPQVPLEVQVLVLVPAHEPEPQDRVWVLPGLHSVVATHTPPEHLSPEEHRFVQLLFVV